jgi:pectate lyase
VRFKFCAIILLMTLCVFPAQIFADITEGFETGLPASSSTSITNSTLASGVWTVYRGTTSTNKHGGTYACLLSSSTPGSYIITPSLVAIKSVTFWARGSGASTLTIEKSVDQGEFAIVKAQSITSGYTSYTIDINETSPDVRIKFTNGTNQSHYIDDISIVTTAVPVITLSSASLPAFGTVIAGSQSSSASYSVSGKDLFGDIKIKASNGYKISTDDVTFSDSLTLTQSGGSAASQNIFVKFSPSTAVGTVEGTLSHSTTAGNTRTVTVSGIAIAGSPSQQPAIAIGEVAGGSIKLLLSGGDGSKKIVVARKGSAVSWIPADGSTISGVSPVFTTAADQGDGNKIVFDGSGNEVTVSGLAVSTTYYFAVFAYNDGSGNSQNYLAENPGTASQSTSAVSGLTAAPSLLEFGQVVKNASSSVKSYTLDGNLLMPDAGNITVTAPAGYQVSLTANSGFTSSLIVPYTSGSISAVKVYVRLLPTAIGTYTGAITNIGGGAPQLDVLVNGAGVAPDNGGGKYPVGFASMNARDEDNTTGGTGGQVIRVSDYATLETTLRDLRSDHFPSQAPTILLISGTLTKSGSEIMYIKDCSNLTVLGEGVEGAKFVGFGFEVEVSHNIIIRNIEFSDCSNDGIDIRDPETHHIWVDHCTFNDGTDQDSTASSHDGALDYKKMATHVTVSWNHFFNHSKTCLFGHTDNEPADTVMCASYHHNWFEKTRQRHPRVRFGKAHVFNNFFDGNDLYSVASTQEADVLMESNYFLNVPYPSYCGYMESDPGDLIERNNIYDNSGVPQTRGSAFEASKYYSYTPDDPSLIPDLLRQYAGRGKMSFDALYTGIQDNPTKKVDSYTILRSYPNPFNPSTTLEFTVDARVKSTVKVYNILGKEIALLFSGIAEPGVSYKTRFTGNDMPSGIYFGVLEAGNKKNVQKMILMK